MTSILRRPRRTGAAVALLALAVSSTACGSGSGSAADGTISSLEIIAPAAPGGGWDSTSRAAQGVLEKQEIVENAQVVNVAGAGGTIGLARLADSSGESGTLMTMGLVMVGAVETNKSAVTLDDVTPIARITSEQEVIVVPTDSPYTTLEEFVTAWKADPGSLAIAGGSAGGTDQIFAGLLAQAAGIDPKKVNYIAFSGGGEALAAILGGKVAAGISGVSEFADQVASGKMRALAVSGSERVTDFDVPTAQESGLDVDLENWRGFVAPPGISDADKAALSDAIRAMNDSAAWEQERTKNGWDEAYLDADAFAAYLDEEQARIKDVLASLGLV